MKHQITRKCIMAAIFLLLTPTIGCSAGKGRPQGPPPEAIQACKDKEVGDTVQFTGRQGETLEATCQEIDGQVVAVPEGMPGGRPPKQ